MICRGLAALTMAVILCTAAATAETFPAFYTVSGVSPNDTLNIREAPSAGSAVLGTLAPEAQNIEVIRLSENGRWALINLSERVGWAATAYLERQPEIPLSEQPLVCYGAEPFWSITLGERLVYTPMDGPALDAQITARIPSINAPDRYATILDEGTAGATAIVNRRTCFDTMADSEFGLEIDFLIADPAFINGNAFLTGCCRLTP